MNWERVRLGEVLEYEQPTNYIVSSEDYDDSFETPVLTAGKSFILGYTNEKENIYTNVPVIIFDDFTTAAKYVDFPFKVKSSAMKILKALENKADIKYLYYKMQTINFNATEHKRYWISKYSQIEIPLPPMSVQKEIVEKLDKAAAIREKSKALLSRYDALAESLFIELFGDPISNEKGWEKKKLGEVGLFISNIKNDFTKDEIYYIDIGSIDNEINEVVSVTKYLLDERPSRAQQILNKGDVLFSTVRPNLRNIAINQEDGLIGSTGFYVIRTGENIKNKFLFRLLLSDSITNDFESMVSGANYPSLRKTDLDDYEIILPPLSLQVKFAEMVENIEEQKARAKAEIEQSEAVFQALLQESFG